MLQYNPATKSWRTSNPFARFSIPYFRGCPLILSNRIDFHQVTLLLNNIEIVVAVSYTSPIYEFILKRVLDESPCSFRFLCHVIIWKTYMDLCFYFPINYSVSRYKTFAQTQWHTNTIIHRCHSQPILLRGSETQLSASHQQARLNQKEQEFHK